MSYYQLNRDRLLEKTKYRYRNGRGRKKAPSYDLNHREVLRENAKYKYISLSGKEENIKRV